jgi:hypothetical protein
MYKYNVKPSATPYLNVRNAPEGTVVGRLMPGQAVIVEIVENGWAKIVDPVISNKPDRQWVQAIYLDLVVVPDDDEQEPVEEYILYVKDDVIRKFIPE